MLYRLLLGTDTLFNTCPKCAWSDKIVYSERKVNLWAENEPSQNEVSHFVYLKLNVKTIFNVEIHRLFSKMILKTFRD